MHRRLCLLAFMVLAMGLFAVTASAQAAPLSIKLVCNPEDTDNWGPDCQPRFLRRLPLPTTDPASGPITRALTYTYAYVLNGPTAIYAHPADPQSGVAPMRVLDKGYNWVRLVEQVLYRSQVWYLIDSGGYLPASSVAIFQPSGFQGVVVVHQPDVPFAWVLEYVRASSQPGLPPEAEAHVFRRYELVNIYDQRVAGGQLWYRVGTGQWVVQTAVAQVERRSRPAEVGPNDTWIDVGLFEQTLAAYEGDRMVYATLVSSGLPQWATVKGLFRIHSKFVYSPMVGREGKPDFYALEDVPWSMYFFQDYALHGAYWHDDFGWQHSHGCVNLAPLDAKWLYDWTAPVVPPGWGGIAAASNSPGTWVAVHD
jgi:lipoprotein-anchoring transpeptidase ErfK/SrfK